MIEIKDTGCGIPEDFRESVFQPFFRVDKSRSREKGGVGLGLSLVWEIARLHGGGVRVQGERRRRHGDRADAARLGGGTGNAMRRRGGRMLTSTQREGISVREPDGSFFPGDTGIITACIV